MCLRKEKNKMDKKQILEHFKYRVNAQHFKQIKKNGNKILDNFDVSEKSILFTGIENYHQLGFFMSASEFFEFLNKLTVQMCEIIIRNDGTFIDFHGDQIVAVFGSPIEMKDHYTLACETAIQMKRQADILFDEYGNKFGSLKGLLSLTIGINLGQFATGFIGPINLANYSAIGNEVNLAARCQNICNQYGVRLILTNKIRDRLNNNYAVRELDKITVLHTDEPCVIYELIGKSDDLSIEQRKLLENYTSGLILFREKKWGEAITYLLKADEFEVRNKITPSKLIIKYCKEFMTNPPDVS